MTIGPLSSSPPYVGLGPSKTLYGMDFERIIHPTYSS